MDDSCAHWMRSWWPSVVAGGLAVLGACTRSDEPGASPGPTAVAQAHAAYAALASVQAAHDDETPAALPPPGRPPELPAPNLYEVGAEGFFLERADAIGLGADAIGELTAIKETAASAHLTSQHEIDVAEQHLKMLTSVATPDPTAIDVQIAAIGRLGAHQRMAHVRAVGRAIAVLDDAQRSAIMAPGPRPPAGPM